MIYDIVTVGTATQDVFLRSALFRRIKDPHFKKNYQFPSGEAECFAFGGKIDIDRPIMTMGGGAANVAVGCARQGLRVGSVYAVGDDYFGQAIQNNLKHEGVQSSASVDMRRGTGYSTILLSEAGERSILVYRGASSELSIESFSSKKFDSRWLYIVPSTFSFSSVRRVVVDGAARGALLAMNPSASYIAMGMKRLAPLFKQLEVLLVNQEEASLLTGVEYGKKKEIFHQLRAQAGSRIVVMTDGSEGVWAHDGQYEYRAGIFKEKKLIDRTGAGDAFGSGFISGLMQNEGAYTTDVVCEAIRLGSAQATSVVERIGAQAGLMSRDDFEKQVRWRRLKIDVV